MVIKSKGVKKHKESILELSAYESYKTTRNIEEAYNLFMQENADALTSIRMFMSWASEYSWQERVNQFDADEELRIIQTTRRAGLSNSLSAEELAAELMQTAKEEMELKRCDMNHRDIARYMTIATKICERWCPKQCDAPAMSVVVNNGVETVSIDDDVLRELGRRMVVEEDAD